MQLHALKRKKPHPIYFLAFCFISWAFASPGPDLGWETEEEQILSRPLSPMVSAETPPPACFSSSSSLSTSPCSLPLATFYEWISLNPLKNWLPNVRPTWPETISDTGRSSLQSPLPQNFTVTITKKPIPCRSKRFHIKANIIEILMMLKYLADMPTLPHVQDLKDLGQEIKRRASFPRRPAPPLAKSTFSRENWTKAERQKSRRWVIIEIGTFFWKHPDQHLQLKYTHWQEAFQEITEDLFLKIGQKKLLLKKETCSQ